MSRGLLQLVLLLALLLLWLIIVDLEQEFGDPSRR